MALGVFPYPTQDWNTFSPSEYGGRLGRKAEKDERVCGGLGGEGKGEREREIELVSCDVGGTIF